MSKRLGDDDAYAVDLLLDQARMLNNSESSGVYMAIGDTVAKRIGAVEAVLRMIGQMPASDPPEGLAARTLERVRNRAQRAPVEGQQPGPQLGQGPLGA